MRVLALDFSSIVHDDRMEFTYQPTLKDFHKVQCIRVWMKPWKARTRMTGTVHVLGDNEPGFSDELEPQRFSRELAVAPEAQVSSRRVHRMLHTLRSPFVLRDQR